MNDEARVTQTSADTRVAAIMLDGPFDGRRIHAGPLLMRRMNVAPPPLFPSGRIRPGPKPPRWRRRALARWQEGEPAPPEPARPPLVYLYAGTLDDGTRIYRFDAAATRLPESIP